MTERRHILLGLVEYPTKWKFDAQTKKRIRLVLPTKTSEESNDSNGGGALDRSQY